MAIKTSIYRGVTKVEKNSNRPWKAQLFIKNKQHFLGSFETETLAAQAYDNAAHYANLSGRSYAAALNFPQDYQVEAPPGPEEQTLVMLTFLNASEGPARRQKDWLPEVLKLMRACAALYGEIMRERSDSATGKQSDV